MSTLYARRTLERVRGLILLSDVVELGDDEAADRALKYLVITSLS